MLGIYFSGTGNSRYALEVFMKEYDTHPLLFSIEDSKLLEHIQAHENLVFSYPVQYSAVPRLLADFIHHHASLWQGKKVFIIATMALFSGDGAGVLGRILARYGARITGGLHLQMPDSIADEKVLKRSFEQNSLLVERARAKILKAVADIRNGKYPQEGLGRLPRLAGFLSQRLWFGHRTRTYRGGLKIDANKCIGCSRCVKLCPTGNIVMVGRQAEAKDHCTVCYRCVNACPRQAITLLGKAVIEQTSIEKYL